MRYSPPCFMQLGSAPYVSLSLSKQGGLLEDQGFKIHGCEGHCKFKLET